MMDKLKILALIIFVWPALVVAGNDAPIDLIRDVTAQIQSRLDKEPGLRTDTQALSQLVEDTLLPHVDFAGLSRLTLGKHWKTASEKQRRDFSREFRATLVRTYSTALKNYSNQKIEFLPSGKPVNPRRATVSTRIVAPDSAPIAVGYSLREIDGAWKIYDVSVEGVSLAVNYRTIFGQEISTHGMDGLIANLVSRNAAGECVAQSTAANATTRC